MHARHGSDSDADSFHSLAEGDSAAIPNPNEPEDGERFTPEKEASLLLESNETKKRANDLFVAGSHGEAIQTYDKALALCPNYLEYETAVLRCNISACHLKLQEWKDAVESATKSLDCLERLDPTPKKPTTGVDEGSAGEAQNDQVEEVDDATAAKIEALDKSGHTRAEVQKIRVKALMRRAKGREEVGGWASLQGAMEDYNELARMPELSSLDKKTVQVASRRLPPRLDEAKNREMGEMMGKLKDLGNGILKPFGLSTDNFQFTKDDKSGGYSMQFNQGNGKAG